MLYENIKAIIDSREQSVIATKHFSDDDVIELIEYMLAENSIIDRLVLVEGSLTSKGINYIVDKYSHKLRELDISDNELTDNDVQALLRLPAGSIIKVIAVNNNFLSKDIISELEKCGFEYLEAENQEQVESSEKTIQTSYFTPQLSVAMLKNNSEQEVNDGKRKANELLLDSKYSFFLQEADPQELEVFFQVLYDNSSLKRKKQHLPLSAKTSP